MSLWGVGAFARACHQAVSRIEGLGAVGSEVYGFAGSGFAALGSKGLGIWGFSFWSFMRRELWVHGFARKRFHGQGLRAESLRTWGP